MSKLEPEATDLVECDSLYGGKKSVPRSSLKFRPGAYALMCRDGKMLLVKMRLNGKYCLPGGGMEPGEMALDALRREVREETGLEIVVGGFMGFYENFYYYDPQDNAWHGFLFCWACQPLTYSTELDPDAGDEEEGSPEWVDLHSLRPEDCQGMTFEIICQYLLKQALVDTSWTAICDHLGRQGIHFG